jgi:hypothetical protein
MPGGDGWALPFGSREVEGGEHVTRARTARERLRVSKIRSGYNPLPKTHLQSVRELMPD